MIFTNLDIKLSKIDVSKIESELGIKFPSPLLQLFIENNGGEPDPYVYQDDCLNTIVNETLPLMSNRGHRTAIETYKHLVLEKELVDPNFFPFAVDPGGDYFFVDCNTENALVFFYKSDSYFDQSNPLLSLGIGLKSFWNSLKEEDEQEGIKLCNGVKSALDSSSEYLFYDLGQGKVL